LPEKRVNKNYETKNKKISGKTLQNNQKRESPSSVSLPEAFEIQKIQTKHSGTETNEGSYGKI